MGDLERGTRFGDYQLERLIGRGAMGVVWLASDSRLGRRVALKFLPPELAGDPTFRTRFIEESRLAASLDHPNIVPVHEAGERDGRLFIAMRFVEGADLEALLRSEGPMEPRRALALLRGVAGALDAAHARGLVHRDVKPGNVLVATTNGTEHAYLSDFGLTKRLGSGSGLTAAGHIVGSVGYIAPEQIEGAEIDGRADIYSLGCMLYATLTGQPPFDRASDVAVLWAHVHAPPPRLSADRPALAVLEPVVERAMAKRPQDRYPTATAFLDAADAALEGRPDPTAAVRGRPAGRRPRTGSLALAGGAAVLGALALLAIAAQGRFGTTGPPASSSLAAAASVEPSPGSSTPSSPSPNGGISPQPSEEVVLLEVRYEDGAPVFDDESVLVPGTRYEMAVTRPRTRFTIPGPGWHADRDYVDGFNLNREVEGPGGPYYPHYFSVGFVQVVFEGPCFDSPTRVLPQQPAALMEFLLDHPSVEATPARPRNFGQRSGLATELTIASPPPEGTCTAPTDLPPAVRDRFLARTYLFQFGEDVFHISPDERIALVAVETEGRLMTLMYGTVEASSWGDLRPEGEAILESMEFLP